MNDQSESKIQRSRDLQIRGFRKRQAYETIYLPAAPAARVESKLKLHSYAAEHLGLDQPITYLEFGVFKGATIDFWSSKLTHAESQFIGFDSFLGLPEDWAIHFKTVKAGAFTTGGKLPGIADPRVRFVKGWFQNTLHPFLADSPIRRQNKIVVHFDADLYSSTLFLLTSLWPNIESYHFIMDDFAHDDIIALADFMKAYPVELEWLADCGGGGEECYAKRFWENAAEGIGCVKNRGLV